MLANILTVARQVLILFILIGVGFVTNRAKIFNKDAVKRLTDFMLYVVTPAVIINSFNRELNMEMLKGLGIVFAAALVLHIINALFSVFIIHDRDKSRESVMRMAMIFSNCGYMSFPLQEAILGSDGVFYGAAYVAVFNIVVWTYGEYVMNKDYKFSPRKILLNPGIIGTAIGLVIFFTIAPLTEVISAPISYLADLNTPVAMVIIGYHLADARFKIRGMNEILSIAFRLLLSPIIMIAGLLLCGVHGDVLIVCAIAASAPVAAVVTMFANKFDADTPLSATLVSVSTLLSIITMPIIVGIAQGL